MNRTVAQWTLHPRHKQVYQHDNDIAMIKLNKPVQLSVYSRPACLPTQGQEVPLNTECYLSGKLLYHKTSS